MAEEYFRHYESLVGAEPKSRHPYDFSDQSRANVGLHAAARSKIR
jgi:hypothetical protein